jgi:hypothetical protein
MKKTRQSYPVLLLLGALAPFLSGCMSEAELMTKEGYPPAYTHGYDDGCHSGKMAGGNMFEHMRKDVRRFDSDRDYRQGWNDGYESCEKQQEASDRAMQRSIEQQRMNQSAYSRDDAMARDALKGVDTRGLDKL